MENNIQTSFTRRPFNLNKVCKEHSLNYVAICVNRTCKRIGPVCYNCVFFDHSNHQKDCIPLSQWKIEIDDDFTSKEELENNLENVVLKMRDTNNMIQSYFTGVFENLHIIKEKYENEGLIRFIESALPIWKNYIKSDNEYVITKSHVDQMIRGLLHFFINKVEKDLSSELNKNITNVSEGVARRSPLRFKNINGNWSHSTSYYDLIGFKTTVDNINLVGCGLFKLDVEKKGKFEISVYEGTIDSHTNILKEEFDLSERTIDFNVEYSFEGNHI